MIYSHTLTPLARSSTRTTSTPRLSMMRMPLRIRAGLTKRFSLNPETVSLQVRQETTLGSVVSVRTVVTNCRALAGYLAYSRHVSLSKSYFNCSSKYLPRWLRLQGQTENGILYSIVIKIN